MDVGDLFMVTLRKLKEDIYYIGGSDYRLSLFENLFPIENGVSYNSYLICDEKTCVLDTVDHSIQDVFFAQLETGLQGRTLDYLIVNHLEPDHSSCIFELVQRYPNVTVVLNKLSNAMLQKFMEKPINYNVMVVNENDILDLGKHKLTFITAPMVHWPEVMVTYDIKDKILFSADAFGTFGGLAGNIFSDEMEIDSQFYKEARRYYTNIVGKYGTNVQGLLKKAQSIEIQMICPLHGPIWRQNFTDFIQKYDLWSRYEAEDNEIIILYASMYNNTYHACMNLASILADCGVKNLKMYDVSKTDVSYLIAEIFRVKTIVLACPNYNAGIYPKMHNLLMDMKALNVSKKNIAIIENSTWAPVVSKQIREILLSLKEINILNTEVKIQTVLKENDASTLNQLAQEIVKEYFKK